MTTPIYFPYYDADIKRSKPLGEVTLDQFLRAISNPKPHIRSIFAKIAQAEVDGDMGLKAQLKTSLFSFTPAVRITGRRRYMDITEFTGLMPLDFDHLPSVTAAKDLKNYLFETYDFIIAAWLSPSARGVRALVRIPVCKTVNEYKAYYHALGRNEMQQYIGFDLAPQNPVLPLFLSYDPFLRYRDNAWWWQEKYLPLMAPNIPQYKYDQVPESANRSFNIIRKCIDNIVDNGHPQLRAAAYSLGGFVGANYLMASEAEKFIISLIHSNPYLSQKPEVYIKTAKEMIAKGIGSPLYLNAECPPYTYIPR